MVAVEPTTEPAATEAPRTHPFPLTTYVTVGAVLVWFMVQLAPFIGEAPDLDGMVSLRGSLTLFHEGLHGLIASSDGTGIHPPLFDFLSFIAFAVLGEGPAAQQILAIPLFVLLAGGTERLLAPYLTPGKRVLGAFAVAICPSLAISLFFFSREAMIMVILVIALALARVPRAGDRRPLAVGALLALLPLIKENGAVLVLPFAIDALLNGPKPERLRRLAYVAGPAAIAAVAWRIVLTLAGGSAWHTWVLSSHSDDGPYVVAARAMLGLEKGIYLRQNLANAFIVNYLWLPAGLALVTIVLLVRKSTDSRQRRLTGLLVGLALVYAWTTLTFPTFTEPRYAAPLTMLTILVVLVGLPLWPRRAQPWIVGALLVTFAAGAWSPTDPISRKVFGTVSVGGEQIYNTAELQRGPDRMGINFAVLRASRRMNERLRRIFRTDATLVTGDCNAMKFGEKLFSVGFTPSAFDQGIPGARPLKCVFPKDLPPGATSGKDKIVYARTPEEDATNQPPAVSGPSVIVIH